VLDLDFTNQAHLRNDLFCVEWDVKPQLSQSMNSEPQLLLTPAVSTEVVKINQSGVYFVVVLCSGDLYTEAAEAATAAMKGRIASKYYVLADEAWAQVTD